MNTRTVNTNGKVIEVILLGDDNGFFDYFAERAKQSYGNDLIIPQDTKQKSIVVKGG